MQLLGHFLIALSLALIIVTQRKNIASDLYSEYNAQNRVFIFGICMYRISQQKLCLSSWENEGPGMIKGLFSAITISFFFAIKVYISRLDRSHVFIRM